MKEETLDQMYYRYKSLSQACKHEVDMLQIMSNFKDAAYTKFGPSNSLSQRLGAFRRCINYHLEHPRITQAKRTSLYTIWCNSRVVTSSRKMALQAIFQMLNRIDIGCIVIVKEQVRE